MDNLGAIGGPLLALALVAAFSVRTAILLSIIPGLLAVVAIVYAIRHTPKPTDRETRPLRFKVRPVLRGRLGRFLGGVTLFEAANMAATLMILRATDVLAPDHGQDRAIEIAIGLYVLYNVAATLVSIPGGSHGDRRGMVRVFAAGVGCFAIAYAGFAFTDASILVLGCGVRRRGRRDRARRDRRARRGRHLRPRRDPRLGLRAARGDPELREPRRERGRRPPLHVRLAPSRVRVRERRHARRAGESDRHHEPHPVGEGAATPSLPSLRVCSDK